MCQFTYFNRCYQMLLNTTYKYIINESKTNVVVYFAEFMFTKLISHVDNTQNISTFFTIEFVIYHFQISRTYPRCANYYETSSHWPKCFHFYIFIRMRKDQIVTIQACVCHHRIHRQQRWWYRQQSVGFRRKSKKFCANTTSFESVQRPVT